MHESECSAFAKLTALGAAANCADGALLETPPVLRASGASFALSSRDARSRSAAALCLAFRMLQTAWSSSRVFKTNPEDHTDFPAAPDPSKA